MWLFKYVPESKHKKWFILLIFLLSKSSKLLLGLALLVDLSRKRDKRAKGTRSLRAPRAFLIPLKTMGTPDGLRFSFYDNCRNSRTLIGQLQEPTFIVNKRTDAWIHNFVRCVNELRADNFTICYRKKQIDVSFSCVCLIIDNEFRQWQCYDQIHDH